MSGLSRFICLLLLCTLTSGIVCVLCSKICGFHIPSSLWIIRLLLLKVVVLVQKVAEFIRNVLGGMYENCLYCLFIVVYCKNSVILHNVLRCIF